MGTPIHRKTREVQFAAGGRQIPLTFPLIDARIFGNAQSIVKRGRCNLPPAGCKLHRLFHSSMPEFSVFSQIGPPSEHHKKVRRSTKGSVQVQVQPTPPPAINIWQCLAFHVLRQQIRTQETHLHQKHSFELVVLHFSDSIHP